MGRVFGCALRRAEAARMHPALAALVHLGNCSCVTLPSYVRVGRLCIALPRRGPGRGEADQDKGPVDLCPAERTRHGWRALDLPARDRESGAQQLARLPGRGRSSTAVPDAVLPPPSMESCASRQLFLHCSTFRRPCRSPAPAALVHLTARDGGNAEGL